MKTKKLIKSLSIITMILFIFSCSFVFVGCWGIQKPEEKLINTSFEKIVSMKIKSVKDNQTYDITDVDKMKEIYDKYSVIVLQQKEQTGAVFSELPNQGKPAYYIHISYLEN